METLGLIAAIPMESQALLRLVGKTHNTRLGRLPCFTFSREPSRKCVLVTSGMGVMRAYAATKALIAACQPDRLISFGIAGAVDTDLKIGDVILASSTCTLEHGRLGPFRPLSGIASTANQAVEEALAPGGFRLVTGTAVTTRVSQLILDQPQTVDHPVLEMETAGILDAAVEAGVPLSVLRAVSDDPAAPIPFDLESVMDDQYNFRPGRLLAAILKHPRILLESGRMTRNSQVAAGTAAKAILALLEV